MVVTSVAVLMRLTIARRVSAHMTIVIIVTGGSCRGLISLALGKQTTVSIGYGHTLGLRAVGVHASILVVLRRSTNQHRIVCMRLDVLLEILRTLKRFAAKVTLVRFQRHMDTDMRSNVITLHRSSTALVPLARQVQIVGALAANVLLTNVLLGDSQLHVQKEGPWEERT